MSVRPAAPGDLPALQPIELAANELFRPLGMHDVAAHPPPSLHDLRRYQRAGRAWVSADAAGLPVGYVLVELVDGAAHLEQLTVHPDHQRQGRGRVLIDTVDRWAVGQQLPALTLSTFRHVPWNGPYYARLGFRELGENELTPGLLGLRVSEAELGLDPAARMFMRRATNSAAGGGR